MTETIITNPRLTKNRRGKTLLKFDLLLIQDPEYYIRIRDFVARRNVKGAIEIRTPIQVTRGGAKTNVDLSLKEYQLLCEKIEEKWGKGIDKKATFVVY